MSNFLNDLFASSASSLDKSPATAPPVRPVASAPSQELKAPVSANPARIYYVHAPLWGHLSGSVWPAELARCAAMGFDQLLISPPFVRGITHDLDAPSDLETLHPALGGGPLIEGIGQLADLCTAAGLRLAIDLPLAQVAADGRFAADHPDWLRPPLPAGAVADPRRADVSGATRELAWPSEVDTSDALDTSSTVDTADTPLVGWTIGWLQSLVAAGVAAFRCLTPLQPEPAVWQRLIDGCRATAPATTFMAWTPGVPQASLESLGPAGFDATFSSLPWWDGAAGWLIDEAAVLRRIGAVIAAPEAPFAPRRAPHGADDGAAHRQALWLAVATGDGVLVPMGYEYGAAAALDRRHHAPGGWEHIRSSAAFDLGDDLRAANAWLARHGADLRGARLARLGAPGGRVTALRRQAGDHELLILSNPSRTGVARLAASSLLTELPTPAAQLRALGSDPDGDADAAQGVDADRPCAFDATAVITLAPGEVLLLRPVALPPVVTSVGLAVASERQAVALAVRQPRIAIDAVEPTCDGGRFAVKRSVGDAVRVEADVWIDGHDQLAVQVLWRSADGGSWTAVPMQHRVNDRWVANVPLQRIGRHLFCIEAWRDTYATWASEVGKKHAAGVDVRLELEEGRQMIAASAAQPAAAPALRRLADQLAAAAGSGVPTEARDDAHLRLLLGNDALAVMRGAGDRPHRVQVGPFPIDAERLAARFASWYELFPRSQSPDPARHGTFDDVITRLPAIAAMGFDVLYFPPIHPIGTSHRKGRNNSLVAADGDPGSPYAIGSADGGHDAIHPELGTLADFRRLRLAAQTHGLELAIDFAIQCSPDHPWLREHPEWFMFRADGTVRYAENPPKKYEDIVNVDFYSDRTAPDDTPGACGLWLALRDVVLFWADEGVRLFRVDNPHTKPLPFWEWLIGEVRGLYPDAVFLAEAFTRPKMMARLAKVGFSQSYSYFTWRNTKHELTTYLTELNESPLRDVFRPHLFVNTPDINPTFLQTSGRPGFLIRAALAATLSGLWGMYNGYEVCEAAPHVVGGVAKEEYADSEKYQFRHWDWDQPGNIVAEITRLNAIRRANPALHSHLGVRFLTAHNPQILFYARATEGDVASFGDNVVLVAVNLDPHHVQEADIELPLWEWGLPDDAPLDMHDLMQGTHSIWRGKAQHLRLDPRQLPFAIWRAQPLEPHA